MELEQLQVINEGEKPRAFQEAEEYLEQAALCIQNGLTGRYFCHDHILKIPLHCNGSVFDKTIDK